MNEVKLKEIKGGKKRYLLLLFLIPIFAAACIMTNKGKVNKPRFKGEIAAANGSLNIDGEMSEEELAALQGEMSMKVKESEIAFKVNSSPVAADGQMNIMFESPDNNLSILMFSVILDESQEVVYETDKALPPGSSVEFCSIKELPKGSHKATVAITSYSPETREKRGELMVGITINV